MEPSNQDLIMTAVDTDFTTKGESCGCKHKSSHHYHQEEKAYGCSKHKKDCGCDKPKKEMDCCSFPVYPVNPCADVKPMIDVYDTFASGDPITTYTGGSLIEFPSDGEMTGMGIIRISPGVFRLVSTGLYQVDLQVGLSSPCQLVLRLNGAELDHTVVGVGTSFSQVNGNFYVRVNTPNSTLGVYNPTGNGSLAIANSLGGARPVTIHLRIEQSTMF